MSIRSSLTLTISSLLVTSALVFVEAPVAMACSTGGAGSSGVSHGSVIHPGSVTVCVGVQTNTSQAPVKPPSGISVIPAAKPACPSAAQKRLMPKSPDVAERWVNSVCASPIKSVSKPAAPVNITPIATSFNSASVSFSPNPLTATVYPGPKVTAGQMAAFRSNPSLHFESQQILGRQAEVQFKPAWLGWQFSDGPRVQGINVKRVFEVAGKYRAWAIASYFVSYRVVGESTWQYVPGQISILSNVLELDVSVNIPAPPDKPPKPLLVGQDCSANPGSWGCVP